MNYNFFMIYLLTLLSEPDGNGKAAKAAVVFQKKFPLSTFDVYPQNFYERRYYSFKTF